MKPIFNIDQMSEVDKKLGKSIYFLNIFTEYSLSPLTFPFVRLVKARTENQSFEDVLALNHESFDKVRNEFEYRVNKLYSHPLLGDVLDNGEIDYVILDVFEGLLKNKKKTLYIGNDYGMQEFMKYPIIRALLDYNIVFKSKYYSEMNIEHQLYYEVMEKYV
jgi:hypothetical protein